MKTNKFWSLFMMFVLVLGTTITLSSCGSDDEGSDKTTDSSTGGNNGSGNNGSGNNGSSTTYDKDGWTTNPAILQSVVPYYVGYWYDVEELEHYCTGMSNKITSSVRFNSNGTGETDMYQEDGSFTWKVIKTKRPNQKIDYIVFTFRWGKMNMYISNGTVTNSNFYDQYIGYALEHYGNTEEDYREDYLWSQIVRHKGGAL